jgi:RsiW-degrading membrane proteinase PrsW (M82 family)
MANVNVERWFLSLEDGVHGPLTWPEVEERVRTAHAEDSACVRPDGSEAWKPYKSITPLATAAEPPKQPPLPVQPPGAAPLDEDSVRFCQTAVRIGLMTPETAHQVLEQRRVDRAIGYGKSIFAYLEEHGTLTVDQIAAVLAAQKTEAPVKPAADALQTSAPPRPVKPLKLATLFPFRAWLADRPWANAWVCWFAFFALFPILLGQLLTVTTTLGDVIWALGAYFAVISGFILYFWLRPPRIPWGQVLGVGLFTATVGGFLVLGFQNLPIVHQFYEVQQNPDFGSRIIGCILGTGVLEEGAKGLPIFWLFIRKKQPAQFRVVAFLAAVSGLAFGVMEAVRYSYEYAGHHAEMLVNIWQQYGQIPQVLYAMFVVQESTRLIALPLLHALFAAIAGTFIAFGATVPSKKWPLILSGWGVAATLHGLYDAALYQKDPSPWLAMAVALLALLLFVSYSHTGEKILETLQAEQTSA